MSSLRKKFSRLTSNRHVLRHHCSICLLKISVKYLRHLHKCEREKNVKTEKTYGVRWAGLVQKGSSEDTILELYDLVCVFTGHWLTFIYSHRTWTPLSQSVRPLLSSFVEPLSHVTLTFRKFRHGSYLLYVFTNLSYHIIITFCVSLDRSIREK